MKVKTKKTKFINSLSLDFQYSFLLIKWIIVTFLYWTYETMEIEQEIEDLRSHFHLNLTFSVWKPIKYYALT